MLSRLNTSMRLLLKDSNIKTIKGLKMIENLKSELEPAIESYTINEFEFVIYKDNDSITISGKGNTIPWDSLPESYDDSYPRFDGRVSFTDGGWVELEETSVMGCYYYDWVYHKCPTLQ